MAKPLKRKSRSSQAGRAVADSSRGISRIDSIGWWKVLLQALVIVAAGTWIYTPVLHGDWLWEDNFYLTGNPLMDAPGRLMKIWFVPGSFIEYYPIEESVRWMQWHLWREDTLGYHVTNLVLHLINALLVWRLFSKFGLRLAWLGGLIFAIHPVMVESVAWITELKNTLSLAPFLVGLCFYLDYEDRGRKRDYLLALGFFLAAMLCKVAMAPFPLLILLFGWWKRGRIGWNDLRASAPFFVISLVLGMIALRVGDWFGQAHLQPPDLVPIGGFFSKLVLAGLSIVFYAGKSLWPVVLLPIYSKWTVDPPSLVQYLPWLILCGLFYLLWLKRATWGRHALLGLGFFLIFLAPFLGFHAISYMSFTWVMDHFLYLPIIGLIGLLVAGLGQMEARLSPLVRPYGLGVCAVVMVILAWKSHTYAAKFVDEETLWTYTLQHNPNAWMAHYNLGEVLTRKGQAVEAMDEYDQAFKINPAYAQAHNNKGILLFQAGRVSKAIGQYQLALGINPNYAQAHNNLGNALCRIGRVPEALEHYEEALRIDPDYAEAYNNKGGALGDVGRVPEAIAQFERALQLKPDYAEAAHNLGKAFAQMGRFSEAISAYQNALRVEPDHVEVQNDLGIALARLGRKAEAGEQFREALRLNPNFTPASRNLDLLAAPETKALQK